MSIIVALKAYLHTRTLIIAASFINIEARKQRQRNNNEPPNGRKEKAEKNVGGENIGAEKRKERAVKRKKEKASKKTKKSERWKKKRAEKMRHGRRKKKRK